MLCWAASPSWPHQRGAHDQTQRGEGRAAVLNEGAVSLACTRRRPGQAPRAASTSSVLERFGGGGSGGGAVALKDSFPPILDTGRGGCPQRPSSSTANTQCIRAVQVEAGGLLFVAGPSGRGASRASMGVGSGATRPYTTTNRGPDHHQGRDALAGRRVDSGFSIRHRACREIGNEPEPKDLTDVRKTEVNVGFVERF